MTSDVTRHFTVEETEAGWIIWVKITTPTKRYQGPASLYPFPSADAAWRWVREQFGADERERSRSTGESADEAEREERPTANGPPV